MVRSLLLNLSIVFSTAAIASIGKTGFSLKTNLKLKDVQKSEIISTKTVALQEKDLTWVPLTEVKDGTVVVGRLVKAEDDYLEIEYKILDSKRTQNNVLTTARVFTRLNEPTEIEFHAGAGSPNISLTFTTVKSLRKANR